LSAIRSRWQASVSRWWTRRRRAGSRSTSCPRRSRTALGGLEPGDTLNLEPSLRVGDRLGGHVVQGHVDVVGRVRSVTPEGDSRRVWIDAPHAVLGSCIEKGSIAVDGVSLTVAAFDDDGLEVALIPHTLTVTTLGRLQPGDELNLEADVLGKVVERLVAARLS
jgi:riboflavin synthase